MAGMTLDNDTLCLYKFLETPPAESAQQSSGFGIKDSSPNDYHLLSRGSSSAVEPSIIWGPKGNAARTQFARYFFKADNTYSRIYSDTIDQNFIDAQRADHTWQVYFKSDSNTADNEIFAVGDSASVDVAKDWLIAATILSNGNIRLFWESNDVNQQYDITGITVVANTWHTLMFSRRVDPGSNAHYITRVFFDGSFVEEFDRNSTWNEGDGTRPLSTSGTLDQLILGSFDLSTGAGDFNGAVAGIRCVELALTDTQMQNDHLDWVANDVLVLDNHGASTTLCHYDLNEQPEFLDESPNGFHGRISSTIFAHNTYEGSDPCTQIDLVGTNGHLYHMDRAGVQIQTYSDTVNFQARHGRKLYQFFNDDIDVPEWTAEYYMVWDSKAPSLSSVVHFQFTGGAAATAEGNELASCSINTTTFVGKFDRDRGVDSPVSTSTPGAIFSNNEQIGLVHLALRCREDPMTAGNVLLDFFVNGVLKGTTATGLPAQNGSSASLSITTSRIQGYTQEFKLSKVAVSDAQILLNAQAIGADPPQVLNVTPISGSSIPDDQILEFDLTEPIGIPISVALIWLKYKESTTSTVVYDGAAFLPPFAGTITDTVGDGSSLHFEIRAEGRWRDDIEEMRVRVVGTNGLLDVEI